MSNAGTQSNLSGWVTSQPVSRPPRKRKVISLFDQHGLSLLPWKQKGYECIAFNPKSPNRRCSGIEMSTRTMKTVDQIRLILPPADEIEFLICVPPCRDLCQSGARWWAKKSEKDPEFQTRVIQFILDLHILLQQLTHVKSVMLLPASARLKSIYKPPDFVFSPHEFAGYLPCGAPHPLFPDTIPIQDRYTKRTFVYTSNGVSCPCMRTLSPIFTELRSKSGISKRISPVLASRKQKEARCVVPLGFSYALASGYATESVHSD